MFYVYILYSIEHSKPYTGYTNNVERRLREHNVTETSGFTLRFRPWTLIRVEEYKTKTEAMQREKYLKTGNGRNEIKVFVKEFLSQNGAVSA